MKKIEAPLWLMYVGVTFAALGAAVIAARYSQYTCVRDCWRARVYDTPEKCEWACPFWGRR